MHIERITIRVIWKQASAVSGDKFKRFVTIAELYISIFSGVKSFSTSICIINNVIITLEAHNFHKYHVDS